VVQSPMQASGLGDGFHVLRAEWRRPGERLTVQMVVAFIGAEGGSAEKKKEGEEGAVLGCHVEKGVGSDLTSGQRLADSGSELTGAGML
jgi:hypothetical protein